MTIVVSGVLRDLQKERIDPKTGEMSSYSPSEARRIERELAEAIRDLLLGKGYEDMKVYVKQGKKGKIVI